MSELASFEVVEFAVVAAVLLGLLVIDSQHRAWRERLLRKQDRRRARYLRELRGHRAAMREHRDELRDILDESIALRDQDPSPPTVN